jgi:hypothetical protein
MICIPFNPVFSSRNHRRNHRTPVGQTTVNTEVNIFIHIHIYIYIYIYIYISIGGYSYNDEDDSISNRKKGYHVIDNNGSLVYDI